jgi:hypothetical protein
MNSKIASFLKKVGADSKTAPPPELTDTDLMRRDKAKSILLNRDERICMSLGKSKLEVRRAIELTKAEAGDTIFTNIETELKHMLAMEIKRRWFEGSRPIHGAPPKFPGYSIIRLCERLGCSENDLWHALLDSERVTTKDLCKRLGCSENELWRALWVGTVEFRYVPALDAWRYVGVKEKEPGRARGE